MVKKKDSKILICRICLECGLGNLSSLFEKQENILIRDKINYIINIDISENDGLPDKICLSCMQALDAAYEFKQKCERSNNMLRSAIDAGVPFHKGLIEDLIKQEPLNSEHDEEPVHSGELQEEDIKHEYEYTELTDGDTQGDDFQPSEQLTAHTDSKFKSKAIDLHLECHDCGQFFKSKCKLRVHWKREHLLAQLTCPNCKKVCHSYKSFHAHMRKKSKSCIVASKIKIEGVGKSRTYFCTQCEYNTNKIDLMKIHWRKHTGERPYSCDICNKSFTQIGSLSSHKEVVHKIKVKEGICKHCGKHILGRAKFNNHVRAHSLSYPCKLCGRVLKSKKSFEDHTKRHSGIKSYTCEICAKMFVGVAELSNHKAIIHFKSRMYSCDRCEFSARTHKTVSVHKKRHTDTNIPCLICGTFVENKLQLKLHQERHNKNFDCEHCGKSYYSWKNVLSHIRKTHKIKTAASSYKKDAETLYINFGTS